jgi:hypothetical protein
MTGLTPAVLWVALGWYANHQWSRRMIPGGICGIIIRMSGLSLADAHGRWVYPHRLEGRRLIMFYDDRVSDPQGDLQQMEDHMDRMEKLTQLRVREKVYWMRGPFFGDCFSMRGVAVASSKSPPGYVDSHELAHAFLNQHVGPGNGPPLFLVEGWAEAQSQQSRFLAGRAVAQRNFIARWAPSWPARSLLQKREFLQNYPDPIGTKTFLEAPPLSYLRVITNPFWSRHNAGAVYWLGGAFVDFFIRRYGASRFVELYYNTESRGFESECRRLCKVDLNILETEFWQDVERTAHVTP